MLLACALPARAAYLQLTQDRILVAHTTAGPTPVGTTDEDNQRESSPALGSFNRAFSASSRFEAPPPSQNSSGATATASQVVNYNPTAINARLDLGVHAFHSGGASSAESQTNWRTAFRVDQPTDFHLVGDVLLQDFGNLGTAGFNSWSVSLIGAPDAGGEADFIYGNGGGGPFAGADQDIDVRGTLRPGYVYTFAALLTASKATEGGVGIDKRVTGRTDINLFFVPEPSAAAVLALGATLLLRRRQA
jgi:hypothetical protein